MEKFVANVRLLEKEEFLDFSRQLESHSCKETCSFLVNNFFRRKDSRICDGDNNNDHIFTNLIEKKELISKSVVQRQVTVETPQLSRSMTFSTAPKQSITIFTPTSTRTTILSDKKTTLLLNSSSPDPPSRQTSSILSTSPEVFNLLSTPSTKTELIFQGELCLCRLGMERTVLKRLVSSTCLRKWERHRLVLDNCDIHSTTPLGFMENAISYKDIREILLLPRLNHSNRFCIQLLLENQQSVILQTCNLMQRSQWFYSIQWRTAMVKFDSMMRCLSQTSEIPTQEFMDLVSVALKSAIKDNSIQHYPLHALSFLLSQRQVMVEATDNNSNSSSSILSSLKEISLHLSQLLDTSTLTKEMCDFYNKHKSVPCYRGIILTLFKPVVLHVLKHDVNFSKNSRQFAFVQDYIVTVGKVEGRTKKFLRSIHGDISSCPHRNILPNLVSLCISSLHNGFQVKKRFNSASCGSISSKQDERLNTFFGFLENMSEFDDWRLEMSRLLQSVPFADESLEDKEFFKKLQPTLSAISEDGRCEVHCSLLKLRTRNVGWLDLLCPQGKTCLTDEQIFTAVLERLVRCCCKRKSFVEAHLDMTKCWIGMAIAGNKCAIELLVLTMEYNLLKTDSEILDVKSALSATIPGREELKELNRRQDELKELQQKEGPLSLTLPARSTDADLARTLSSGPFGNVESLNLAFTMVTSSCALDLIKLPSLKHLNLWSTKFGDEGLQIICEHMPLLQVLNLCETPVTDKGLKYLPALKNLQKLNLNSTNLSAVTFESLKEKLPSLQECDVCYTDAW